MESVYLQKYDSRSSELRYLWNSPQWPMHILHRPDHGNAAVDHKLNYCEFWKFTVIMQNHKLRLDLGL